VARGRFTPHLSYDKSSYDLGWIILYLLPLLSNGLALKQWLLKKVVLTRCALYTALRLRAIGRTDEEGALLESCSTRLHSMFLL
jgi:hypothetical protein